MAILRLQSINPDTEFSNFEAEFLVEDLTPLIAMLHLEDEEALLSGFFNLTVEQCSKIVDDYGLTPKFLGGRARLSRRYSLADLPYQVHTDRELELMLAGTKPLAAFDVASNTENATAVISEFDAHVATGRFVKREFWYPWALRDANGNGRHGYLFYARPEEEWRIDAYILLIFHALGPNWNETHERIQGTLLGYEDWQNEEFIQHFRPHWEERKRIVRAYRKREKLKDDAQNVTSG